MDSIGKVIVRLLIVLVLASVISPLIAETVDPQNIVIENVYLATGDAEDTPINLLVRNNKLELLSKNEIPIPDGFIALDANGGYLVGNLTLGKPPAFMILDADPRLDFEVLLRHSAHSVFVVNKGQLHKNSLHYAKDMFEPQPQHERTRWHAYSPPPVALPTHYGDSGAWNHWATKNTSNVFFSVLAIDRQYWQSQNNDSMAQVGDLEDFDGGEVRDFRLGLFGTLKYFDKPWGYNIVVATNAFNKRFEAEDQKNFRFLDYRLDIPIADSMKLSIGKQKEPISMERIMTLINLPMQERSTLADAFLTSRNFGAHLSGNALNNRMSWAGGVFNNFIDSDVSFNDGATAVTGRVSWLPFISEDQSNLVHLALALRLEDGNQGYLYRAEPEFGKAPLFVNTTLGASDKTKQHSLEASWRRGPVWLAAEYLGTHVDSPTSGGLDFSSYHINASWILTGEMRDYLPKSGTFGAVPISRSVYQNGMGAWEIALRWSSIDLNDGPVVGGEMDILSLGLNWWLSPIFNVNLNYRYITHGLESLDGQASGVNIRVLLKLN